MKTLISASILSADFGKINEEIRSVESYVDLVHIDVMDGHFVSNLTFGPPVVKKFKCAKPMDVHLMIEKPENYLEEFAEAITKAHGRRDDCYIIVHQETCKDMRSVIKTIKKLGCKAGVSINPGTPVEVLFPIVGECDLILIMTVNPGLGGQKFMEDVLPKIGKLRALASKLDIAVDGGINDETAKLAVSAGANVLVAGSYIFKAENRAKAIEKLR